MSPNLQLLALALAGALGGLAGAVMIQGDQYALKIGFSSNYGFDGIVVGLLSRGSAAAVVAGVLLRLLPFRRMSMEMMARVPSAVVWICQGLIVIAIAGSAAWLDTRRRLKEGDQVNGAELGLFIASSLRLAMPLLLAATGELVSEKADP